MVDLYIDGRLVVLPENFSITVIDENPFFTNKGTYTYDITLSLLDPINAKIYGHLNRINKKGNIPENRTAYMVVDNEVVLNGTEVILEHTESQAKIQLVAGNSELRFQVSDNRKLRDLDLGKAVVDPDTVKADLDHPYPERNWLILPYIDRSLSGDEVGDRFVFNRWNLDFTTTPRSLYYQFDGTHSIASDPSSELSYYKNYRPQPYLCFIIEAVLKSLGYTLIFNSIAGHPVLRYMYIVHGFDTWEFAKMLPDWTVQDFLKKIETQFDCTFVVDKFRKTAGLYFNYDDLIEDEIISVEMLDEYTLEVDKDNTRSIQSANIGYDIDLSDDDYYLYQKLDKTVNEAVKQGGFNTPGDLLNKINDSSDKYRLRKIFRETLPEGTEVIAGSRYIAYNNGARILPRKVDSFRDLIRDPEREEIDITFDILPAPMDLRQLSQYYCQYPVVSEADPVVKLSDEIEEDFTPVQDLIEGDDSVESISLPTKMYLAMYSGRQKLIPLANVTSPAEDFPIPYVESLSEFFEDNNTVYYFNENRVNPFRLEWLKHEIYDKSENVDLVEKYKISFMTKSKMNLRTKFIANNKALRCERIERTITAKGFEKICKGDFYAYKEKKAENE
ncbi:MAG: hypothetical protein LBQ74_11300 [Prevotella sp.]|jgi:hypothetical protein|nr:hypothetical protein [Prevotella sp.]